MIITSSAQRANRRPIPAIIRITEKAVRATVWLVPPGFAIGGSLVGVENSVG
jgi:hypothetical protein